MWKWYLICKAIFALFVLALAMYAVIFKEQTNVQIYSDRAAIIGLHDCKR